MNEGDRVDDVLAVDRAMTQLESRRLSAVYELVCTARETVGNQFAERSVREELRLARRVSPGECVGLVELAVILHERHPELLACLAAGLLDQYRAEQACQVLQSLTIEQTRVATARIAERLRTGERPFHWREYVRRVADAVAPEAKRRRTAAARRDRWLRFDPGPDGAGMLLAQLPNEVLAHCGSRVETTARSLRAQGDRRNLEQLRADTLTELLCGNNGAGIEAIAEGCAEHTGTSNTGTHQDSAVSSSAGSETTARGYLDKGENGKGKGAGEREVRAVINVHMPLGTALHIDEHEATIDGYGPIPAEAARELLGDPNNAIRKVLTDPDTGTVVGLGRRRYRPSIRQRDYIRVRDRHCRIPGCARPIAEIDHAEPWHQHGPTDPGNLQGLCQLNHRLKSLAGWEHRLDRETAELTVTTPTGRTYHSAPEPARS